MLGETEPEEETEADGVFDNVFKGEPEVLEELLRRLLTVECPVIVNIDVRDGEGEAVNDVNVEPLGTAVNVEDLVAVKVAWPEFDTLDEADTELLVAALALTVSVTRADEELETDLDDEIDEETLVLEVRDINALNVIADVTEFKFREFEGIWDGDVKVDELDVRNADEDDDGDAVVERD